MFLDDQKFVDNLNFMVLVMARPKLTQTIFFLNIGNVKNQSHTIEENRKLEDFFFFFWLRDGLWWMWKLAVIYAILWKIKKKFNTRLLVQQIVFGIHLSPIQFTQNT